MSAKAANLIWYSLASVVGWDMALDPNIPGMKQKNRMGEWPNNVINETNKFHESHLFKPSILKQKGAFFGTPVEHAADYGENCSHQCFWYQGSFKAVPPWLKDSDYGWMETIAKWKPEERRYGWSEPIQLKELLATRYRWQESCLWKHGYCLSTAKTYWIDGWMDVPRGVT